MFFAGIALSSAKEIVQGLCDTTKDEETKERIKTLEYTYQRGIEGKKIEGAPPLVKLLSNTNKNLNEYQAMIFVENLKSIWNNDKKTKADSNSKISKVKEENKEKDKKEISIFKYSARFRQSLHEAVLIDREPYFLVWNEEKQEIDCIGQIEENRRTLRPPDDSEYPYEPIEFGSFYEITTYTELVKSETIDSLYQKVKSTVALYIDQEDEIINLISADIIWTYFQDLFATTHYYDVNGKANGIGKSSIGFIFEGIGYAK